MTRCRLLSALAAALLVTGCGSSENTFVDKFVPFASAVFAPPEPQPRKIITRAELNEIPFATIAISRAGDTQQGAIMVPLAKNGPYLVYQDAARRGVAMEGGLITGTDRLAYNIKGVARQIDDPIAVMTPPTRWPDSVVRNYQFIAGSSKDYEITVTCTYQPVVREPVVIFEITFDLLRIEERCTNSAREFSNVYWAEPDTGFIWKSQQWIGPKQPPLIIEIVRPFTDG